jgi:hypothetical protein
MNGAMVRRGAGLVGVCLGVAWTVAGSGCLIINPPQFVSAKAVKAEGSCMCSLCWNQPFCFDPTRPEGPLCQHL